MKKKKRGSSLTLVLVIFLLLITTGTAMISLTSTTYKSKILQSNRIMNLYSSESGIDIVQNIITRIVQDAIEVGNLAVDRVFSTDLNLINIEKEKIKNGEEPYFKDGDTNKSILLNSDFSINRKGVKEAQEIIFTKNFEAFLVEYLPAVLEDGNFKKISDLSDFKDRLKESKNGDKFIYDIEFIINPNYGNGVGGLEIKPMFIKVDIANSDTNLTVIATNGKDDNENNKTYSFETINEERICKVNLESEFYEKVDSTGAAKQLRKIAVDYKIQTPSYNEKSTTVTEKKAVVWHPILDKVISVDGDMTLSGGDIKVEGDIFVNGNDLEIDENDVVFSKYNGGLEVTNKLEKNNSTTTTNVYVNGNIVSPKSINIRSYSNLNFNGDIYSGNIHLGNSDNSTLAQNNSLKGSIKEVSDKVFLRNDLSIYSKTSDVVIDEFYGLSDIPSLVNESENKLEFSENISIKDKAKSSSSIIINSKEDVSLKINNKAYIWGTAYINTESKYQTGESIAVKGNYIAYSTAMDGYDNVEFKYDAPLQLISAINGNTNLTAEDKAKYFVKYTGEESNTAVLGNDANIVKVELPEERYSVGAYINNGTADISNDLINKEKEVMIPQREKLSINAYRMGIKDVDDNKLKEDFINGTVVKNIKTEILFNNIKSERNVSSIADSSKIELPNGNIVILNKSNKNVVLLGENIENYSPNGDEIIYKANNSDKKIKGLIITSGNVKIVGEVKFEGAIIAGGDFNCDYDDESKLFKYNSDIVKECISAFYSELYINNVINHKADKYEEILPKVTLEVNSNVTSTTTNSEQLANKYVKQGTWKIIK